jgi:hypothetical protein
MHYNIVRNKGVEIREYALNGNDKHNGRQHFFAGS